MDNRLQKIVVVEDEAPVRESLRLILENYFPGMRLLGMADSVKSGLEMIRDLQPNVILLDIQLPDGTGFDIADQIQGLDAWIIFTTAHNEFALKAFNYMSLSFLLKPVDPIALSQAFQKIEVAKSASQEQFRAAIQMIAERKPEKIALPDAQEIRLVLLEDIIHCHSYKNYTEFHTVDGTRITVSKTLKYYDDLLPTDQFLRIHQQHLINLDHLKSYIREDGGYVLMTNGARLEVSQRKKSEVLAWLGQH